MSRHVKLVLDSMRAYNELQTDVLPDQATRQQMASCKKQGWESKHGPPGARLKAKSKAGTRSMAHLVPEEVVLLLESVGVVPLPLQAVLQLLDDPLPLPQLLQQCRLL